jgi:hypothetical protein
VALPAFDMLVRIKATDPGGFLNSITWPFLCHFQNTLLTVANSPFVPCLYSLVSDWLSDYTDVNHCAITNSFQITLLLDFVLCSHVYVLPIWSVFVERTIEVEN